MQIFTAWSDKIYHPAMAAFVLDPIHYTRSEAGSWYPPFPQLEPTQVADALKLIKRVSGAKTGEHEAQVESEWAKYRLMAIPQEMAEFLPFLTTRNKEEVSDKAKDKAKTFVAGSELRLWVWEAYGAQVFPWLAKVACMIIGRHVTSAATERNWITWGRAYARNKSQLGGDRANKLLFIAENKGKGRAFMEEEEVVLRCLG